MAGYKIITKQQVADAKLLFLQNLSQLDQAPHDAINKRESLEGDHGAKIKNLTPDQLVELKAAEVKGARFVQADIGFECSFDIKRTKTGYGFRLMDSAELSNVSMLTILTLEAVIYEAIVPIKTGLANALYDACNGTRKEIFAQQEKIQSDILSLQKDLEKLAVDACIRPKLQAIRNQTEAKLASNFNEDAVVAAKKLFLDCASQLVKDGVSEADQSKLHQLEGEAAKGLFGYFDVENYTSALKSLPLERSWARIIGGTALAFAGLMLAAGAIALAVMTSGVSTPASVAGVVLGVDMMLAGFAMVAAVTTFSMAGCATFFANSKVPTKLAEQNPEGVQEIIESANYFSKVMGG